MSAQIKLTRLLHDLASSRDPIKNNLAKAMIDNGTEIVNFELGGKSLLHVAVKSEALGVIESLLKRRQRLSGWDKAVFDLDQRPIELIMRSPNANILMTLFFEHQYLDIEKCCNSLPWEMSTDHLEEVVSTLLQLQADKIQPCNILSIVRNALQNNRDLAHRLVISMGRVNEKMFNLQNLLRWSVQSTDSMLTAFFVREGADINKTLQTACSSSGIEILKLLLRLGAEVDSTDQSGYIQLIMRSRDWDRHFYDTNDTKIKCMIRHLARLTSELKTVNPQDLSDIENQPKLRKLYNLCTQEIVQMKTVEAAKGFTFEHLFSDTSYKLSASMSNAEKRNEIERYLLGITEELFPNYKDDIVMNFEMAKEISNLVSSRTNDLEEIFGQIYPRLVVFLILDKIAKYSLELETFEKKYHLNKFL